MQFTKRPTARQVRQGLALFALAKPLADDARKARQAHAIEADDAISRPDMAEVGPNEMNAEERARGSKGQAARGGKQPQSSPAFCTPWTTTGGLHHG
nr:hypothetical protein [Dechloromonas sp.]